jgi:hypothetical protein
VDSGDKPSINIGPDGEPAIAYQSGGLKFARFDGSMWIPEVVDSSSSKVGDHNSLAYDQNGRPAISYRSYSDSCLKFAWCY